ncbi:hypothetical protein BC936DRAFT_137664 [Jimgerdemannia flammicorona]|uniref:Uncharacterized protein n=1 Tax=Jimgerdemannia flammicorona TaxID=994334 RepID=A0A433DIX3_9FUNG|nr:hypothetical protein BC936DRAFT_137664 [Jimgerdemannia flammicorona]
MAFIVRAELRYVKWMNALNEQKPDVMPVPPIDVAMIWHTHCLSPIRYYDDIFRLYKSHMLGYELPVVRIVRINFLYPTASASLRITPFHHAYPYHRPTWRCKDMMLPTPSLKSGGIRTSAIMSPTCSCKISKRPATTSMPVVQRDCRDLLVHVLSRQHLSGSFVRTAGGNIRRDESRAGGSLVNPKGSTVADRKQAEYDLTILFQDNANMEKAISGSYKDTNCHHPPYDLLVHGHYHALLNRPYCSGDAAARFHRQDGQHAVEPSGGNSAAVARYNKLLHLMVVEPKGCMYRVYTSSLFRGRMLNHDDTVGSDDLDADDLQKNPYSGPG